ncbi:hypothetical protein JX265_012363 [Neoarthrinium moseri]|uniref:PLL-like beta propeller domain-containing protein n=1 Tax=Neoarthrinium moseri TaxID=1658444 RepID=A0A9P9WAC0_9PEZI|nr:hypothetical protein JX265_012363 [Neoarthrinium moseri]
MNRYKLAIFLSVVVTDGAVGGGTCLSTVSWSNTRVDLFAVNPDASIGHKFWTGWDWQPSNGLERLPSKAAGCPSVTSWGEGRLDVLYINESGNNVLHKYFGGGSWGPSWEGAVDLGGEVEAISSLSWGEDRLDIVGRSDTGSYVHKAWTGQGWYPSGSKWEDFGGYFFSNPATLKFYHRGWSEWEDLGGGPFVGNPVATSWGKGRLDFWAIDSDGALNHIYWNGKMYSEWEHLGGEYTDTPKVVHWKESHIDIVGKGLSDDKFHVKNFDGSRWNPSKDGWYDLAGPFSSEPALETKHGSSFLYVLGVNEDDEIRLQIWSGSDWQPGSEETWSLGRLNKPSSEDDFHEHDHQFILGALEL